MKIYSSEEWERKRNAARKLGVIGEPYLFATARVQDGQTTVKVMAQITYGKRTLTTSIIATNEKVLAAINLALTEAMLEARKPLINDARERALDALTTAIEEDEEI